MTLVDLSLVMAAVNSRAPHHRTARQWFEDKLNSEDPLGLSWLVILGFIRLSSHPKILPQPMLLADSIAIVDSWIARPNVKVLQVTPQHWNILQNMLHAVGHGAALTLEAHLACLAIEHDAELATADDDFAHFPGLKWHNPLKPEEKTGDSN